jgi:hypothetical protein
MRFRGTLVLLVLCAAVGAFIYYYEIKGGEKREQAKQEQNRLWKLESSAIQQIDLITAAQHIRGVRTGEKDWKITLPRELYADSDEFNKLAGSVAELNRESVIEPNATDLSRFGLSPAEETLELRTKDGKEYGVRVGNNNPTGSSTYAALKGKSEVFLIASSTAGNFRKKLDDLRNRSVLSFETLDVQTLDLKSAKGEVDLAKENDKWWIQGKERWNADSSAVSDILSGLSSGRVKEFFDDTPDSYVTLGFDKPVADVRVTLGKDRAIKHLVIGMEKSKLLKKGEKKAEAEKKDAESGSDIYTAMDQSRKEVFFVDKELVDKLLKSASDLRDKKLATFQRWDIDSITLTNSKGTFAFAKSESGGDWVLGDSKKKTKWDAVNGILDSLEKQVKGFVDAPATLSTYGLDAPAVRVVLKQGGTVKAECAFGKEAKDGVYAQVAGEPSMKIADKEVLDKLNKSEADFVEPPPSAAGAETKK